MKTLEDEWYGTVIKAYKFTIFEILRDFFVVVSALSLYIEYVYWLYNWGEPERAPHRWVCCGICLYYYIYIRIVRCAISHFWLLFCKFLRHSLIKKLFTNNWPTTQREDTNCRTSLKASARTETTRGPTYSMTRAIWANQWQKGFICQCRCLRCHYSPLTVEVTHHMDRPLQWLHRWACWREYHLSVDTSCKAHGVLDLCACSNHTDRAWHACWTS